MRIIIVGATGTIGRAVSNELATRHDVIRVGHTSGEVRVDMTHEDSVRAMYKAVGTFDALLCTAGHVYFGPFDALGGCPRKNPSSLSDHSCRAGALRREYLSLHPLPAFS